ncbi:TetR family transcriptional regulator [Streptomyces albiflavescens]|uniref:TetR family transcriptional regulator n=1 Tax=Streptomyces albiflavescens TaxID=1623582 RepID=A0A917XZ96_9ACTN|nr:TetR/AcrR family transcriptional regulator [Streptomyces albiflavescens]GGN58827.1 TetR family transcriptional regulator [Streptomyces albiflavescens]
MTSRTNGEDRKPRLRADAARNRAQILAAARTAFRELGTAAPLDEIARRAGVNIATLYRRFPDREALVQQVVIDGFTLVIEAARHALDAAPQDSLAAIEGFLLRLVDARDILVLPLIGGPVPTTREAVELQAQTALLLEQLMSRARSQGTIRPDATHMDLITTAALTCRPMPYLPTEQAATLATRHVHIFMDGLRPNGTRPLPPSPTHEELSVHLHAGPAES